EEVRQALPVAADMVHRAESELSPTDPVRADAIEALARAESYLAHLDDAQRLYERDLALREATDPLSPGVARALDGLAQIDLERGDVELAESRLERARAIVEEHPDTGRPTLARILLLLGSAQRIQDRYTESRKTLELALEVVERQSGRTHPE